MLKHQQAPEDMPRVNFLISLLERFPEIFTVYHNISETRLKITFMLKKPLEYENYIMFKKMFTQSQAIYNDLQGNERAASFPRLKRTFIDSWTLLEVTWEKEGVSLEEINLACSLVLSHFRNDVFIDLSRESQSSSNISNSKDNDKEFFLSKKTVGEEEKLFAFRESGKVYVFDR